MKVLLCASVAGVILGCSVSVSAQTQPANKAAACVHPAPYADENEYVAERTALSGGRGERVSCMLRLRLANGRNVQLVDRIEDSGEYRRYVYERYIAEAALHLVSVHLYEGGAHLVVHSLAGSKTWLPGPPLLSPDGRRFTAASSSLDDHYAPNRIEIWRDGQSGLKRELAPNGAEVWSPENLVWDGSNTVRWTQVRLNSSGMEDRRGAARLLSREGRLSVEWAAR